MARFNNIDDDQIVTPAVELAPVKVRKYYILTEYPDRLEYEETFYENEATHYAELRYSVADGKEIECFHEIIREHSELTTGSSLL